MSPPPASAAWRERARARKAILEADASRPTADPVVAAAHTYVMTLLACADGAIEPPGGRWGKRRFRAWWTGWRVEKAWRNIHDAEVLMTRHRPWVELDSERESVRAFARDALPRSDARLVAIEHDLDDRRWPPQAGHVSDYELEHARARFGTALRTAYEASDDQYVRLRSFRNIILVTTLLLGVLAVCLGLVGLVSPSVVPLCFEPERGQAARATGLVCPTGTHADPSGADVVVVELLGMVGAGLSAAFALRNIRGTSTPYDVPVALAALKVPAGALTAVVGLLFVNAGFAPGLSTLDGQSQLLAYAVLFGAAQQLITRLVDAQGQTLLNAAPPNDRPPSS